MSVHIIYIMVNDKVPDLVKIGKTTTSVEQRSKELSRDTGVPGKWVPLKWWHVPDCHIAERHVHKELSAKRLQKNKEFFMFNGAEAVREVHYCLARLGVADWAGCEEFKELKEEEARIAREKEAAKKENERKRQEEQRKYEERIRAKENEIVEIKIKISELKEKHFFEKKKNTIKELFSDSANIFSTCIAIYLFFTFILASNFMSMLTIFLIPLFYLAINILNFYFKKLNGSEIIKEKILSDISSQIKTFEGLLEQKTKEFNHST